MFYQCPKCNNVWQYPIKKCLDCHTTLKRVGEKNPGVIGVSKVSIPTLLHPKVPYYVLVLEDENHNRWTYKSFKEYKIGDFFSPPTKSSKETVAIWRVKYEALEAIEKTVDLMGGIEVDKESKVLIMPTLVSPQHPYFSSNTSPQFLASLIEYLIQKGVNINNIKIASQSFGDFPIETIAQKSQLLDVCEKRKINPLDLSKTNFIKKQAENFSLEISEEAFNQDLIINLPILKIDRQEKIKGAADNLLKFLKKESYLSLKYLHDYKDILKALDKILPRHISIAEAIYVQKSTKLTTFLGLALASFNAFNLDRVFAEIIMLKDLPEHLKNIKIEDVPINGRQIEELQYDVERF